MQDFFDDFIQKPSDIQAVFVSDLHLSSQTPLFNDGFIQLLNKLDKLPNLRQFYILGDWFDGWIGDDAYLTLTHAQRSQHWLTPILYALHALAKNGVQIFVMHGNRDFTISQKLCDQFNGKLIFEPHYLSINNQTVRLEHGDALCTDDIGYQRYRKWIRHRYILPVLLRLPLSFRQRLAGNIKAQSGQQKQQKTQTIMDANPQAVQDALATADLLIHGHTHRPNHHQYEQKSRLVLGDWRDDDGLSAVIGVMIDHQIKLAQFNIKKPQS